MTAAYCRVQLAGESVLLLADRALYWPAQQMLVVADIHFGKAVAFRTLGVPVPRGTTTQNLQALDALLAQVACRQIVFLGDFLHAKAAHAPATVAAMLAWRRRHPQLQLILVRGNHDVHAGDPASQLQITLVDEPYRMGPFAFCHHPETATEAYVLAGHVHPVFHLRAGHESLRLPCFLQKPAGLILPSFGAFTGGYAVRPAADENVFVLADGAIFAVP